MISSVHGSAAMPSADSARGPVALYAVVLLAFAAFGLWITGGSRGNPAVGWMLMFAPEDFVQRGALTRFLFDLQSPIPPWLATLEILSQRHLGSPDLVTVGLYRFCMVGGYLIAMALAWPSLPRLAISALLSALFLSTTVLIHPASPIVYDVVFPFLLIAYFALLRLGAAVPRFRTGATLLVLGGFCLALAELTRPFLVLFLPLLLVAAWWTLHERLARFTALVLPVVLVSGAWHLHQWVDHGQLAWSNHAGFNLIRAWRMVPYPELIPEPGSAPVALRRLPNLNTPEHGENSRRLRRAVVDYALAHPAQSLLHMAERIAIFTGAGHQIEDYAPDHPVLPAYDVVVRYANIAVLAAALLLLVAMAAAPRQARGMMARVDNQMLGFAALAMALIAVTESGEEARFQISLLPLIAAVPAPLLLARDGTRARLPRRWRLPAIAALLAVVATVEILAWGSTRQPMPATEGGPVARGGLPMRPGLLRVAQFNVRGGAWQDRAHEIAANAACLSDLDLAGLAELRGPGPFGLGTPQVAPLAAASGLAAIDAPVERRWWSPNFGNALLTRIAVDRWRSGPLPHGVGNSYRGLLTAEAAIAGRKVTILVAQVDNHDHAIQIEAIERAFQAVPAPAVLLADFGTAEPRLDPLKHLLAIPGLAIETNQPPYPEATVQGGYVIAKGMRATGRSFCKGGVSMQPRLAVDLVLEP